MNDAFISTAISQINWEKYKRGYSHVQDLDALKDKLRKIQKENLPLELTKEEIYILKISANNSINKILNYDYGGLDEKALRNDAVDPIYQFMNILIEMEQK